MALHARSVVLAFFSVAIVSFPLVASADMTSEPPPATAPAAAPAAPAPVVAAKPAEKDQAAAERDQAAAEKDETPGHFRWGISPMAGTFFPGPTTVAFGIEGRAGYAFGDRVTLFGSLGAVDGVGFGGSVSSTGASASVSAISYWYVGANVDALLAGPLFAGAGASIGKGGWGVVSQSASASGGSQDVVAAGGIMPSFDARIGLTTGTLNKATGKRSGFAIALDLRMLVAPNSASVAQNAGSGGGSQSASTSTTAIGWSPMLMMGYELR